MKAHEIMTKDVVTVEPQTRISEIAALMVQHRISGVPVVTGEGQVVGIVSESDLLHRVETGSERKRKWWLELFVDSDTRAREFIKSHGLKAEDIMSRVVVSITESADLRKIADVLEAHGLRRVPVLTDGKLVGIVSRADLVRALASATTQHSSARSENNGALQNTIYRAIKSQPWIDSAFVSFSVSDGIVEIFGFVSSQEQQRALRVLIESVPGVQKVISNVRLRTWEGAAA